MRHAGPTLDRSLRGLGVDSNVLDETMVASSDAIRDKPDRPEYAPGTAISRYVVLYEVGAGGMGVVYAAFDPQLNRKIALKILIPRAKERKKGTGQAAARLMREAQAIARLSHPNVVNVYDVGRHGDAVFVAMEFIEGETLTRWLAQDERSLGDIRRVFALAGHGLSAAHAAGLVHRDFKPDNVLVSPDGRVRVLDFGLARADPTHASQMSNVSYVSHVSNVSNVDDESDSFDGFSDGIPQAREFGDSDVLSSPLTRDDAVVGTPRYMPPEQHAGVGVDARSDQFSFCVALYQALYGQEPFPANRLHDLVRLKQRGRIAPVPSDANVPPWLEDLVMRGLSPKPGDRWPSMEEVVGALEDDPSARRSRRLTLVGGAVLLAAATAVVGHQLGSGKSRLCQDSATHTEPLWNDARRDQIRGAILSTGLPYAEHTWAEVERRVDGDLDHWVETHQQTCEATRVRGEQSDEMLDLRMSCLQGHLGKVRAVLDVLAESDPAVVQRAVSMVSGLGGLEHCANVEQLRAALPPPEDEATRQRVQELRDMMRQAEARQQVRKMEEARELAERALREAEALQYEPLRLEALLSLGVVLENAGEFPESEARLREAMWGAVRLGHERVASRASIQLVSVVGDRLARYDEGLTWSELADALLDRMGDEGAVRVGLVNNTGNVWHRKGDKDKALDHYQRAVAMREGISDEQSPALALERVNLGNAQLALGKYEEALASYQQAEASMLRVLGEGHPQIALAVASIGLIYNETGRFSDALGQHRRAMADFEAWLGPDHLYVATVVGNLGVAQHGEGRMDEALASVRRSEKIFAKSLGSEHPQVAASIHNQGTIVRDQGKLAEAQRLFERAHDLRRAHYGEDHEDVVSSRIALAEMRRRQGEAAQAVSELEALAVVGERAELRAAMRGEIHLQLAQARWDAGQEHERVLADLDRAREFLLTAGPGGNQGMHDLDTWATEHAEDDRPRDASGAIMPAVVGGDDQTPEAQPRRSVPPPP